MIHTARQLKDLVRNRSKGNSTLAQTLLRNYAMERFLERIAMSPYKDNFILKGGMLVSAIVGLDTRMTMDMDATLRNLHLSAEHAKQIVSEITSIQLDDNMRFEIKSVGEIMNEAEYSGIRIQLDAFLETMRTPLKIDISTGDVITPHEVEFSYPLMFEDRSIPIKAYNLETVLAEKIETVLSRSTGNTRLRDFYDLYILNSLHKDRIGQDTLRQALHATSEKRGSLHLLSDFKAILWEIRTNDAMEKQWQKYQQRNDYASAIQWSEVMNSVFEVSQMAIQGDQLSSYLRR